MTTKIAVTGKSGSGKTTIAKSLLGIIREYFPEQRVLVVDNDLSAEFGHSYGLDIRNTIYGIRSGKHEYKTGIPQHMTKAEYDQNGFHYTVFTSKLFHDGMHPDMIIFTEYKGESDDFVTMYQSSDNLLPAWTGF